MVVEHSKELSLDLQKQSDKPPIAVKKQFVLSSEKSPTMRFPSFKAKRKTLSRTRGLQSQSQTGVVSCVEDDPV